MAVVSPKHRCCSLLLTSTFVLMVRVGSAAPVPIINLNELVDRAELILVGKITSVMDVGPGSTDPSTRMLRGDIDVDTVVKGPELTTVRFTAAGIQLHVADSRQLAEDAYRIFFLKRHGDDFEFVSSACPSITAARGVRFSPRQDSLDRAVETIGAALRTAHDRGLRMEAISVLCLTKRPGAVSSLHAALADRDRDVRLAAAAGLLWLDDVSALPLAEAALLRPGTDVRTDSDGLYNLRSAIAGGLKDKASIPSLARLLRSHDNDTRRAAACALGHTRAGDAILPLLQALDDLDLQVRHNAVRSFADIAAAPEWAPSRDGFLEDPERYISHWRSWAATQKP